MIAAKLYLEDFEIHTQIDRWENKDFEPNGCYMGNPGEVWEDLGVETQQTYIEWVFFLLQSGRL
jgi:hypothetical protein